MKADHRISDLIEREKELECLYLTDEALTLPTLTEMLLQVSKSTALGFSDVDQCAVTIQLDGKSYAAKSVDSGGPEIHADIVIQNRVRGRLTASYPISFSFTGREEPFLPQEQKLLQAIALKLSHAVLAQEEDNDGANWRAIIKLLQHSDRGLLMLVSEKMMSLLAAEYPERNDALFQKMNWTDYGQLGELNAPLKNLPEIDAVDFSNNVFQVAAQCFPDKEIYENINLWIFQRKTYDLIALVNRSNVDAKDIAKSLKQYIKAVGYGGKGSEATQRWLIVELSRRLLTEDPKLIEIIRHHVRVEDFSELLESFISSPHNVGRIGGKATGFFVANCILRAHAEQNPELRSVRMPKTWYLSSNELELLLAQNSLEELNEHKYKDSLEIRICYPKIIQTIKSLKFSAYVRNELSELLDQCGDTPLIIRSSGQLEDQFGSSFSGKYKSLFIPNQGTKAERLQQLTDGILEVYASVFNPDAIQYSTERNLLDRIEKMGIMIQTVVGRRVGPYYFPLFAGVAFSTNELRWSPRIRREDGLLRMVMGMGTRAVDRVGDDYPFMISPGQPGLTVNHTSEELQKYSLRHFDLIDVENDRFLTMPVLEFLREYGEKIPHVEQIVSVMKDDFIQELNPFFANFKSDRLLVTFDGLVQKTTVIDQLKSILTILKEELGHAVDVEFAGDGEFLYLLQCRPQSQNKDAAPAAIPTEIPPQSRLFTANRYISNGRVLGVRTVVYVDPRAYSALEHHQDFLNVASAVREINKKLPRKSFILLGPGRWGSRGDFTLGVPVTYSDINNTAMLIEVAMKESKFQPELSFGTHFFQDLVETDIKYLPLYPEDKEVYFDHNFFVRNKNQLARLAPAYAYLDDVIRVISLEESCPGQELAVLMNADLEQAVAYLKERSAAGTASGEKADDSQSLAPEGEGWKWRFDMAKRIAALMDMEVFGVKRVYLFGSTNACTACLNSDIDLLIHYDGTEEQLLQLRLWLNGWSLALDEMNFFKTGYRTGGLLDVHCVSDEDIAKGDSYALQIDSVYDPALLLRQRGENGET